MKFLNYFIVNLFLLYQRFKTKLNRRVSRNFSKITSSGISLTFSDQGVGPPLLLLHGITQDASAFDPLIRHLKSRFKIIALDCRGHGDSDKPKQIKDYGRSMVDDVENLLAQLKIEKVHLLGTSMGAEIALRFAAYNSSSILSLTAIGSGLSGEKESENYTAVGEALKSHHSFGPWIKATGGMGYFSPDAIGIATADSMLRGQDIDALSSVFLSMPEIVNLTDDEISALTMPVLGICGELDEERPALERMIGKIPNFSFKLIANRGHMDLDQDPSYFNIIDAFLTEHRQ